MKVVIILSCLAAAFAVPVDQAAYKKPEYKEVEYKEPAAPVEEAEHQVEPPKYEEPLDKSIYPYVVSKGFPYDYRGFPYLNNEFPHGYPAPKQGFYAPLMAPYHYQAAGPAYQGAPVAYGPGPLHHVPAPYGNGPAAYGNGPAAYGNGPAAYGNGPAAKGHGPAHVPTHAAVQPTYKAPVHPAPVKEVATKPKYDSMTYHGQFSKGCLGDGIYYNNLESFILCSNGNPYVQRCAPGTKNQGADHYSYGSSYSFKDLCGINLVDTGYGPSNVVY